MEVVSTNLSVAGATPAVILALDHWWRGPLAGLAPVLLFAVAVLAMALSSAVSIYLFHLWLVRVGRTVRPCGTGKGAPNEEGAVNTPSWREVRVALGISLALLITSIGLSVLFLA